MQIVTRFAPSPTGYLHIGGARTALFSWLLARQTGGKFVLRIEDTDQIRSTAESTLKILEDMKWLGLDWNEGPEVGGPAGSYFQSQRLTIYCAYADKLLEMGRAYKCFETPAELTAMRDKARADGKTFKYDRTGYRLAPEQVKQYEAQGRPFVVRFLMPDKDITVHDAILGDVTLRESELEDFVIVKSDGFPTYHFAVVVDDYSMQVTHILRGQEHLMNTPKHIALQEALGFGHPVYAHMPLIFNMDGTKMSKRDKEKAIKAGKPVPEIDVHDFRMAGYMPESLLNFIALLGWSPGGDLEFMSMAKMIELFSIERIGKTNAKFDREKLRSFNMEYIKNADRKRLKEVVKQFLDVTDYPLKYADDVMLDKMLELYQPRSRTLVEMAHNCRFFLTEQVEYDSKAVEKVLKKEGGAGILAELAGRLEQVEPWTVETIEKCIDGYCAETQKHISKIAQPIRVAVTGSAVSPPLYETLDVLGKEKTLKRILQACKL
ncbi:MAG: glutamate--tRNA ligase [Phycisphaerae bacterium]